MTEGVIVSPAPAPIVRRRPRITPFPRIGYTTRLLLPLICASAGILYYAEGEYRAMTLPVLVMVNLCALYVGVLWNRDRRMPVFEIGSVWVAATLVYASMPFLGFMAMGMEWSRYSDNRLQQYPFDAADLTAFAWRYVLYLFSFVFVYLLVRGRKTVRSHTPVSVPPRLIMALAVMLALQHAYLIALRVMYGFSLDVAYTDLQTTADRIAAMPYAVQQVSFIVIFSMLVVKMALMLGLMQRWHVLRWRLLLFAWVIGEVALVVAKMGERGSAIRLLLIFIVFYHRFVRPVRPLWLITGGAAMVIGFLLQGLLRVGIRLSDIDFKGIFWRMNEFQALFATAYDLHMRKVMGTLPAVPWQVYVSDLYLIIPSQLLPFYKWDPSEWYLEVLGARGTGVGFMFGVMAQAVVGLDWIELALRGALLGLVFALFHRWYVRSATHFWITALYAFVTIWSYYTFRATSFWFVHFIVYQFIPVALTAKFLSLLMRRRGPARS